MVLKNLNNVLDRLNGNLSNDVRAESICALRCALVDFLDDMEHLYDDIDQSTRDNMLTEDYNSIRQMIKMAGELYLNLR